MNVAAQVRAAQRLQDWLTARLTNVLLDARTVHGMGAADSITGASAAILALAGLSTEADKPAVIAALKRAGEMAIGAAVVLELKKP